MNFNPSADFYYAGIGTRRLNKNSAYIMMRYACAMAFKGGKVRSGHADGSDLAFETGAKIAYDMMVKLFGFEPGAYGRVLEIHLPWSGFNGQQKNEKVGYFHTNHPEAMAMAARFHPAWENLGRGPRGMMSRNSNQVMGLDMATPSRFIVCETPDGAYDSTMTSSKTGGTGQAIRVADAHGIKIYNLKNLEHRAKILDWLEQTDAALKKAYGVDTVEMVDTFLANHIGLSQRVEGDLVKMANRGEVDVLVHGTNCFHMNSGIAKGVRETFPEAYALHANHRKGDKKLLGTIESVALDRGGKEVHIVNAYTQYNWGRDPEVLYADYEAIRKVFKAVAAKYDTTVRIGIPRIGAGLGNGCWVTISNIIRQEMQHHNLVLVDLPEHELTNEVDVDLPVQQEESAQIGLF